MTPRGELRRREILDTAVELFARQGYHDTGVADIAAALHMSHGTFYRYFESKRDILDAVVDEMAGRVLAVVAKDHAAAPPLSLDEYSGTLADTASSLLKVLGEDPRIAKLLMFEATGVDDRLTGRILDLLDRLRGATAAFLSLGVEAGYLRTDLDPNETARALNGLIYAGAIAALRTETYPAAYVTAAVELVLRGIVA